ncbi:MAG: hypothetical protein Q8M22_04870 [Actinomycetota bacterium]|nr:hypothetical protein [Actinomycetota bacterium]
MTPHASPVRSLIAVLLVAVTACGSNDEGSAAPTTQPAASTTSLEITTTTTAEPEIIDSVTVETVATPGDGSTVVEATETLRDGVPTVKGTTYSIIDPATKTGFSLVSSVDGAYPFLAPAYASLTVDEAGMEGLITIVGLDGTRTFIEPIVDVVQIPADGFQPLTEPVPADYLAWFAEMPGVTVGPVVETIVDGRPARSMTYSTGPTPNGLPCDANSVAGCLAALWNPNGAIMVYPGNETGTLYELVVDGRRALLDVTIRKGAQEMFESLRFLNENEG